MVRGVFGLLAALVAASSVQAASVQPPPIEDYGKLPGMALVRLSPSGTRYAFVANDNGVRRVVIEGTDNKVLDGIAIGSVNVTDLQWAGDEHLLITSHQVIDMGKSFRVPKHDTEVVTVVNVTTHKAIGVFRGASEVRVAPLIVGQYGTAQVGERWYGYFGGYSYDGSVSNNLKMDADGVLYPDLYQVDLDTGRLDLVHHGDINTVDWLVGPNGVVQAVEDYNQRTGLWTITASQRHDAVIASGHSNLGYPWMLGFGRTPDTVLIESNDDRGVIYQEAPLAGGETKTVLEAAHLSEILVDPVSHLWVGGLKQDGVRNDVMFTPGLEAKLEGARQAFAGYVSRLVAYSGDFSYLIMETEGGDDSGTFWIVNIATHSADPLGEVYPTVIPAVVGQTQLVNYSAADGLAMQGVLTLPPGREAKNLPLVVMPHSGPRERDYIGFNYWAQAFAAQGYAVFQPNYRGSSGYGEAFAEAGYGQWGRKMQTDISDGVAELARQGLVNPARVCIVGAQYGGYAAEAGVTVQHGLYRCAVSVAGVSDLGGYLDYERDRTGGDDSNIRLWKQYMGVTTDWSDAQVHDISPIRLVGRADAPILLIHGDQDAVVPIEQSTAMANALRGAGKPVELVTLPGGDHSLGEEDARVAMVKASVEFVLKNNPPDPAPPETAAAK